MAGRAWELGVPSTVGLAKHGATEGLPAGTQEGHAWQAAQETQPLQGWRPILKAKSPDPSAPPGVTQPKDQNLTERGGRWTLQTQAWAAASPRGRLSSTLGVGRPMAPAPYRPQAPGPQAPSRAPGSPPQAGAQPGLRPGPEASAASGCVLSLPRSQVGERGTRREGEALRVVRGVWETPPRRQHRPVPEKSRRATGPWCPPPGSPPWAGAPPDHGPRCGPGRRPESKGGPVPGAHRAKCLLGTACAPSTLPCPQGHPAPRTSRWAGNRS